MYVKVQHPPLVFLLTCGLDNHSEQIIVAVLTSFRHYLTRGSRVWNK